MIPKIKFFYSPVYDMQWKTWITLYPKLKREEYPNYTEILDYIKKVEPKWRKLEKKVLMEMSKIAAVPWKKKEIMCYVVGRARPFSDPLTLPIYEKDHDWFIDNLIHELVHVILSQVENKNRTWTALGEMKKRYHKEPSATQNHVLVHAIHSKIYLKLFNKKRLDRDIEISSRTPGYDRSWQIVKEEGADKIIEMWRNDLQ